MMIPFLFTQTLHFRASHLSEVFAILGFEHHQIQGRTERLLNYTRELKKSIDLSLNVTFISLIFFFMKVIQRKTYEFFSKSSPTFHLSKFHFKKNETSLEMIFLTLRDQTKILNKFYWFDL